MRRILTCLAVVLLLSACSSVNQRKNEKLAAYNQLSPSDKQLVDHGEIARGMDTNAVFMAWGPPSAVISGPEGPASQTTWRYEGNRAVLVPGWEFLPTPYGYWSLESVPSHHSQRFTKAEVVFQNGRVVDFKRF